ncbi:hypothetical protein SEA_DUMPTRUCK_82 [Gordonia phage DumpTruck]|nr:hypothetical protein SEA_DUMPTRUCK_82 [Gordonia phage DumpTruck]
MVEMNPDQIQTLVSSIGRMAEGIESLVKEVRKSNDAMVKLIKAVKEHNELVETDIELHLDEPMAIPTADGVLYIQLRDGIENMNQLVENGTGLFADLMADETQDVVDALADQKVEELKEQAKGDCPHSVMMDDGETAVCTSCGWETKAGLEDDGS